jgi:hypothetical protein
VRREGDVIRGVFAGMDTRARLALIVEGRKTLLSPAEIVEIDYNE